MFLKYFLQFGATNHWAYSTYLPLPFPDQHGSFVTFRWAKVPICSAIMAKIQGFMLATQHYRPTKAKVRTGRRGVTISSALIGPATVWVKIGWVAGFAKSLPDRFAPPECPRERLQCGARFCSYWHRLRVFYVDSTRISVETFVETGWIVPM